MTEANWEIDVKKRNVCATCKFFKVWPDDNGYGDCKRFPPSVNSNPLGVGKFPVVHESNGCGEYARF